MIKFLFTKILLKFHFIITLSYFFSYRAWVFDFSIILDGFLKGDTSRELSREISLKQKLQEIFKLGKYAEESNELRMILWFWLIASPKVRFDRGEKAERLVERKERERERVPTQNQCHFTFLLLFLFYLSLSSLSPSSLLLISSPYPNRSKAILTKLTTNRLKVPCDI